MNPTVLDAHRTEDTAGAALRRTGSARAASRRRLARRRRPNLRELTAHRTATDAGGQITRLLGRLRAGDEHALDRLVPLLYDDLRRIARQRLRGERDGHTLGPTALVNEAYLRLLENESLRAGDRSQLFAAASETMRRILVDYARSRNRLKRGQGQAPIPLDEAGELLTERQADEVLALEDALGRLAGIDARACRVVQYRFFGGLSLEETAEALAVSAKTVQRSWLAARAWLRKEVARDLGLPL